jgi:hypothetical protein
MIPKRDLEDLEVVSLPEPVAVALLVLSGNLEQGSRRAGFAQTLGPGTRCGILPVLRTMAGSNSRVVPNAPLGHRQCELAPLPIPYEQEPGSTSDETHGDINERKFRLYGHEESFLRNSAWRLRGNDRHADT